MKIVSYNINGIRAAIKKGLVEWINKNNFDVICLQEIKANKDQVELDLPDYNFKYWNSAEKKGYSGTAIFSVPERNLPVMDSGESIIFRSEPCAVICPPFCPATGPMSTR